MTTYDATNTVGVVRDVNDAGKTTHGQMQVTDESQNQATVGVVRKPE